MFGLVIFLVRFGWGFFFLSNFNFFYIDDNEETSLKFDPQKQSFEFSTVPKDI